MNFKYLTVFLALIVLITSIMSCGTRQRRDLSSNVLINHITFEPDGLHPTNNNSATRSFIFMYTQKPLIRIDLRTFETIPVLVKEIPTTEDGISYQFELRDDVTWDDGSPLTVEDVIFSTKVVKSPLTNNANIRSLFANIKDIIKDEDNPRAFTMLAHDVHMSNPSIFTGIVMLQKSFWDAEGIMDKFTFAELEDPGFNRRTGEKYDAIAAWSLSYNSGENSRRPDRLVGLGPYQVVNWDVGNSIMLQKKQNWWGQNDTSIYLTAFPDRIMFRVITDPAPTMLALKREQLDVSTYLGNSNLVKLQRREYFNENYHSDFIDQYGYSYLGLNMRPDGINFRPFFTDRRVRRAMAHLVPVDDLITVLLQGKATRQVSFISPLKTLDYNDELPLINVDIEKAKRLLDEAGWIDTDGDNIRDKVINGQKIQFSFNLNYMSAPLSREVALMIKDVMYQAGIDARPNPMDFALFYRRAQDHEFDAMLGGWSGSASPEDPTQLWHTTSWANKGSNFCGFGDAESDSLIELSNRLVDPEERAVVIRQLQKKIYDDQPYVFLYSVPRKIAIHRRFDNAHMYNERPGVALNNMRLIEAFRQGSTGQSTAHF